MGAGASARLGSMVPHRRPGRPRLRVGQAQLASTRRASSSSIAAGSWPPFVTAIRPSAPITSRSCSNWRSAVQFPLNDAFVWGLLHDLDDRCASRVQQPIDRGTVAHACGVIPGSPMVARVSRYAARNWNRILVVILHNGQARGARREKYSQPAIVPLPPCQGQSGWLVRFRGASICPVSWRSA